jgi:hypothetical protein
MKGRHEILIVGAAFVLAACASMQPPIVLPPRPPAVSSPTAARPARPVQPKAMAALPSGQPSSRTLPVGPAHLYPNLAITPGDAATLNVDDLTREWTDNCPNHKPRCTYSQDHRNVPPAVHAAVYDEYSVPIEARNIKSGEVDHFWPLCAGGSNELKNLWYQPAINDWNGENLGYHEKDKLEDEVCKEIKAGQLDPNDAFQKMTTDWVAFYHEKFQGDSGGSSQNGDQ